MYDPDAVRKSMILLRQDAVNRWDKSKNIEEAELAVTYGWSALRLYDDIISKKVAESKQK
jgi:hypothetical protein